MDSYTLGTSTEPLEATSACTWSHTESKHASRGIAIPHNYAITHATGASQHKLTHFSARLLPEVKECRG